MPFDADDDVTRAAEEAIKQRADQLRNLPDGTLPALTDNAAVDELTRIRFELTALRRLLQRVARKL
jgi:hypothetical protein